MRRVVRHTTEVVPAPAFLRYLEAAQNPHRVTPARPDADRDPTGGRRPCTREEFLKFVVGRGGELAVTGVAGFTGVAAGQFQASSYFAGRRRAAPVPAPTAEALTISRNCAHSPAHLTHGHAKRDTTQMMRDDGSSEHVRLVFQWVSADLPLE